MKPLAALSLGWRTHLIFPRFDAQVVERPGHWLVRTPANPTFWWGNFLLYEHAPREGDAAAWLAAFDEEIARPQPASRHLAFGIDDPAPFVLPADFAAAGLRLEVSTVLTMERAQLRAPRRAIDPSLRIRALRLPDEAARAVELQVAAEGDAPPAGYREFRERQMQRYAAMHFAGWGDWYAVFDGDVPVADCGLFRDALHGGTLGRFQYVSTHPAWRRRGLCSALVHAVCRHAFERLGLQTLVIAADPDDVAIGLYEALGFQRGDDCRQLERPPS